MIQIKSGILRIGRRRFKVRLDVRKSLIGKAVGLLFRKSIDKDYLMIFDMGENSNWEFHTFGMKFPIDMISLIEHGNGERRIFETYPGVKQSRKILLHGKYIIEAQAGFIRRNRIREGERISWNVLQ